MNEYPSNSDKSKTRSNENKKDKKITKVVSSPTSVKKKGLIRRFTENLNPDDVKRSSSQILLDIFLPDLKRTIHNCLSSALDNLFYPGEDRGRRSTASKISYQRYYDRREERPSRYAGSGRERSERFDYDDIIFGNRADAEIVLDKMQECIDAYQVVTVADLFDLADVSNDNYMANSFGWTSISSAKVVRDRDGYFLKLPRPMPID